MSEPKTAEEIQAMIDEAVAGLKSKNDELIAETKRLKADLRKTQEVKPEDMAALESDNEKLRADLAAAQKQAKDATTAAEKASKALETEQGFTQKLIIQDGLKSALIENGVKDPDFIDTLSAKFASGAAIKVDGDQRVAMIGDKALGDYIKEWAGSDTGKKFVAAPVNGGGGAPGGKGGEQGKVASRAQFDGMSQLERATFAKDGGKVVDAAA
jgi:uncharacterized phage infection (PIP) family protein YhgE